MSSWESESSSSSRQLLHHEDGRSFLEDPFAWKSFRSISGKGFQLRTSTTNDLSLSTSAFGFGRSSLEEDLGNGNGGALGYETKSAAVLSDFN